MIGTLTNALLPIVVTLILGFFAGWHHDFSVDQSSILNRMVMLYALPMSLFAGILSTPRKEILSNVPMVIWLSIGMIGGFIMVLIISHFIFKRNLSVSVLQAIAIAGPAVPFVGASVLNTLFGSESTLAIAICGLLINLVQIPICIILLSYDSNDRSDANPITLFEKNIVSTLKEPVVWAPLLAFTIELCGITLPASFQTSFALLGKTTGGVALFSSGIILFSHKVKLTWPVGINILSKNVLLPLAIWALMIISGTPGTIQNIVLISLAIPTGSIGIILAVQFKVAEKEMASTLFYSTILSIVTMGIFMWLTGV
ncbi:AEC family transporter [Sporolactobacillus pectinivorans]|uniref:AEC family transporter n=1 Tax=Sporolactobacillus pectinivorans TaxID=1591408 RepID=UPI000C267150|nr:AEC family transporter [Sporolactobacillus pectinivorans]